MENDDLPWELVSEYSAIGFFQDDGHDQRGGCTWASDECVACSDTTGLVILEYCGCRHAHESEEACGNQQRFLACQGRRERHMALIWSGDVGPGDRMETFADGLCRVGLWCYTSFEGALPVLVEHYPSGSRLDMVLAGDLEPREECTCARPWR